MITESAKDAVHRIIAARIPDAKLLDSAPCTSDRVLAAVARNCYKTGSTPRLCANVPGFARLDINGGGIDSGIIFVIVAGQVRDALVVLYVCNAAVTLEEPVSQANAAACADTEGADPMEIYPAAAGPSNAVIAARRSIGRASKEGVYLTNLRELTNDGVVDLSHDNVKRLRPEVAQLFTRGNQKFPSVLRSMGLITPVGQPIAVTAEGMKYVFTM